MSKKRVHASAARTPMSDEERAQVNLLLRKATVGLSPSQARNLISEHKDALLIAVGMGRFGASGSNRRPKRGPSGGHGGGVFDGGPKAVAAAEAITAPITQGVYVIGAAGHPVKIGIAADVDKRLRTIQTGCAVRLRVYHYVPIRHCRACDIERAAHTALSDRRLNGEWFDVHPDEAISAVERAITDARLQTA